MLIQELQLLNLSSKKHFSWLMRNSKYTGKHFTHFYTTTLFWMDTKGFTERKCPTATEM